MGKICDKCAHMMSACTCGTCENCDEKESDCTCKNVASAITLRTSALAEFVKNVVKKKQSAAVKMLTILAAGAACLQLRLPTSPDPSWLAYFDSCNNRWTHSTKRTYLLD